MLRLRISGRGMSQQFDHASGPIEFGRGPQHDTTKRCVIPDDMRVSRDHMRVVELAGGRISVENLSRSNPIQLTDSAIAPGASRELDLPARLGIGETWIVAEAAVAEAVPSDS